MSTLDSSSSLADVQDAYADNASYAEDGSLVKAKAFITACRLLLLKLPKRASHGGRDGDELELEPRLIAEQIAEAKLYVERNDTAANTVRHKHLSVEAFRG